MADAEGIKETKNYYVDTPMKNEPFELRGSNSLDWGMKNRLSNIFNPVTGRTVMLAVDHGYFMGPTTGLERIDINIVPLLPYADTLMLTRGMLRAVIPPTFNKGVVLRASGGPSILKELSDENIALDMEDAIRLNAAAVAVQVFDFGVYHAETIVIVRASDLKAGEYFDVWSFSKTALRGEDHVGDTAIGKAITVGTGCSCDHVRRSILIELPGRDGKSKAVSRFMTEDVAMHGC